MSAKDQKLETAIFRKLKVNFSLKLKQMEMFVEPNR